MLNPFKMITHVKMRLKQFKKQADELLQANAEFLDSGVWRTNESMTVFYKKGFKKECVNEASRMTLFMVRNNLVDRSTRVARKIFKRTYKFKVKDVNKDFAGKVFLRSTTNRINRFIDYDNKQILLKYKHIEPMQKDVERKANWGKFFNTVPFRKIDYDNLFAIEDYIERKECPIDRKFNLILQDYIEFSKRKTQNIIEHTALSDKETDAVIDFFDKQGEQEEGKKLLDFLSQNGYVKTLSHGDLSPLNVLFDGEKLFYIDLENTAKRSFVFDLFQYMFWCKVYKNILILDDYLNGKFDNEFVEIFKNYGLKFDKNKRKTYYNLMQIENGVLWTVNRK